MTDADRELDELKRQAIAVSQNAWCRYSRFPVGAALETADGQVFAGCNVENASSGLTLCAERNAVAQAVAAVGKPDFVRLVVYTPTPEPTPPCGACRQVLAEFAPRLEIISICDGNGIRRHTLDELLPFSFGPHSLDSV